jgi:hypothetical protein
LQVFYCGHSLVLMAARSAPSRCENGHVAGSFHFARRAYRRAGCGEWRTFGAGQGRMQETMNAGLHEA